MQTVNFLCGHCSKLMAVGITSLGMQVRCPHCQQIVVAPANAPQPPAPVHVPLYGEGIMEDHPIEEESIFSRPVPVDDLFDDPPPAPALLEIPPAPAVSSPTGPRQVEATPPEEPESQASTAVSEESNLASLASDGIGHGTVRVSAPRRYQATGRNWMLWALILPLVSYAILSTILMIILYNQYRNAVQNNDKLFLLPDEGGDNPGVRKNKGAWKWEINPRIYRQPLPPGLLTTLHKGQEGQPLHLGDPGCYAHEGGTEGDPRVCRGEQTARALSESVPGTHASVAQQCFGLCLCSAGELFRSALRAPHRRGCLRSPHAPGSRRQCISRRPGPLGTPCAPKKSPGSLPVGRGA